MQLLLALVIVGCSTPLTQKGQSLSENSLEIVGKIDRRILTEHDLEKVREVTDADDNSRDRFIAHFWDCFEGADKVNVECSPFDEDPTNKGDQLIALKYSGAPERSYVLTRASDFKTCMKYREELKRLTAGQKSICFTGSGGSFNEKQEFGAIFVRLKTQKGCLSYFLDDC
jgi:hypothetical protein